MTSRRASGRSRDRDRPQEQSLLSSLAQTVTLSRVLPVSILTGLGWAVVNAVGVPALLPALSPVSSGSDGSSPLSSGAVVSGVRPPSLAQGVTPDLGGLEPLQPFQLTAFSPIANAAAELSGNQIRINGQSLTGFWQQKNGRIGISSTSLNKVVGVELLSTTSVSQQPVRWFPETQDAILSLPAWWDATDRYIDITDLAVAAGWTGEASGSTLQLNLPAAQAKGVRQGKQPWGDRVVVDLSGPASWRLDTTDVYTVTVAGSITPEMVRAFQAKPGNLITQLHVAPLNGHTVIKIRTKDGAAPQIWTAGNPARLVIDIRRDAMLERDIAWAPGLRWRQQYVAVGAHRFPVYMFIANPNPSSLALRPIHADASAATGIEPLLSTAQRRQVAGAVNGGFFNRNNQFPLGAVRNDGRWISGPILGRGAMAWNEQGELFMERFSLSESVMAGDTLHPLLALNSGYVQAGIGRYTTGWGRTYTPIVDNEIVVTVQGDQVTNRQTMGKAGAGNVAIPEGGYLLTLRSNSSASGDFEPGTRVTLASQSQPAEFANYPNVMGGGPLLIRDRNIVLNPQLEGFSRNFIEGAAPRTAVGKTADGTWIVATLHERVGGRGPNLTETAQIMQKLGAVDALNLDGGSSSSLYLGRQLLNRQPSTAARVNNGIGFFVQEP